MALDDRLDGRNALVTGGSKGAGAATVARLADAGATVMTVARTMPPGYPSPELFVEADLSTPAGAATVIARVEQRMGAIHILVHALGGSHAASGGYRALSDQDWNDELSSQFALSRPPRPGTAPSHGRNAAKEPSSTSPRYSDECRSSMPPSATPPPKPR